MATPPHFNLTTCVPEHEVLTQSACGPISFKMSSPAWSSTHPLPPPLSHLHRLPIHSSHYDLLVSPFSFHAMLGPKVSALTFSFLFCSTRSHVLTPCPVTPFFRPEWSASSPPLVHSPTLQFRFGRHDIGRNSSLSSLFALSKWSSRQHSKPITRPPHWSLKMSLSAVRTHPATSTTLLFSSDMVQHTAL